MQTEIPDNLIKDNQCRPGIQNLKHVFTHDNLFKSATPIENQTVTLIMESENTTMEACLDTCLTFCSFLICLTAN